MATTNNNFLEGVRDVFFVLQPNDIPYTCTTTSGLDKVDMANYYVNNLNARCEYCGRKNSAVTDICEGCGAPL